MCLHSINNNRGGYGHGEGGGGEGGKEGEGGSSLKSVA